MSNVIRKTILASLAALTLAIGVCASATPAAANGYWRHGYRRGGGWGWGPAIVGGLAAGAILGAAVAPYAYGRPYSCEQLRPVYDAYGRYIGRRWVNVCY